MWRGNHDHSTNKIRSRVILSDILYRWFTKSNSCLKVGPFPGSGTSLDLFAPPYASDKKTSVPGHDHAAIGFALDAGASVVIPQVETVAEARHAVSSAKYGAKNHGIRSAPPFRLIPGITALPSDPNLTLHENLNHQAAVMIQIETLEAIDNLDAILTEVSDIDAVWLGTLDVRVSMGLGGPSFGGSEPEFLQAVAKFESILKKHDKPRGGAVIGTPEVMRAQGKDNSISFVAMDAGAFIGTTELLRKSKEMFPAQRKTMDAENTAQVNDKDAKVLTNGDAQGIDAKVLTKGDVTVKVTEVSTNNRVD